ncbi:MAG: 16S rRNA (cytosine(967)-C(5))-methyltransferase RsmB [Acidobacteriota bacterium]|nr:16S rRNA (cytosine(967)-C(5))-methyltransferase RsmB [Blastocatellia bacterium]MDW8412333.1 16S rRNA (cytosine(967)-C(5))-methyltransferase RsmB [Acidobacteriota bacterium]
MNVSPARRLALEILRQIEKGARASSALANLRADKPVDRRLATELVMGVLRNYRLLDYLIERFSTKKVDKFDAEVRLALRLGTYQLFCLDKVPEAAAVNESVNLTKLHCKSAAGLVNAILRKLSENKTHLAKDIIKLAPPIKYSHPDWLYERWQRFWGKEAEAIAAANNQTPQVTFRFNLLHPEVEQAMKTLEGLYEPGRLLSSACRLLPDAQRELLDSFVSKGACYIQDEASQFVAELVDARPGQTVLDLCAAPGGKTTLLAARMCNVGRLIACESDRSRFEILAAAVRRMQAKVELYCCDATAELPFEGIFFDRILVDAPCSGTGTLARNPDIRLHLRPEKLSELSSIQYKILCNAASRLAAGGRLIYATCSLEPEENEHVVEAFLASHKHLKLLTLQPDTGKALIRLWPHKDSTSGFFVAVFEIS